jgi:thiamine-phosphate pyrophosphorylase
VSRLRKAIVEPVLCYVTDRHALSLEYFADAREALLRMIEAAAAAGIDWVQIREKDLSGKECASLTREGLQRAEKPSTNRACPLRIIVNDRVDIALSERAGGVHLGENSLPVGEARRLVGLRNQGREEGLDFLVGVSCHSLETAKSAEGGGADYIFFGPVFTTPSKAAHGAPQGLARLAGVCRSVSLPVLAIGGITLENATSCLAAGAAGIAAIRLFQDAQDLASLVKTLHTPKI